MSTHRLTVLLSLALALVMAASAFAASAAGAAVPANEPRQWTIDRAEAMSNSPLRLTNLNRDSALAWKSGGTGISLYWGGTGTTVYGGTWQLRKQHPSANVRDHRARPIADGERVALYSPYPEYDTSRGKRKGMFLIYHSGSTHPANLKWERDQERAYEWRVDIDDTTKQMTLYNTKRGDYLVVGGALVGWLKNQPSQGTVRDGTVTMTAQPPVQGYVPFVGSFGGGAGNTSVLTEVRNPASHNTTLRFIKPGYGSQHCGMSDAVITLAPGAALTAQQMTTLYGSATPSLANRINFLACAVTNASSVFLNVKYRG